MVSMVNVLLKQVSQGINLGSSFASLKSKGFIIHWGVYEYGRK